MSDAAWLDEIAKRYVWWKPPSETLADYEHFGHEAFLEELRRAPAGVLDAQSWTFWHRWLGVEVPPPPERKIG